MIKQPIFKALKASEPSSSPSPIITFSSEKTMNYYGRYNGSLTTEKLMEEEGKGRLKHQCFCQFQSFGKDIGSKKKGRGFFVLVRCRSTEIKGFSVLL